MHFLLLLHFEVENLVNIKLPVNKIKYNSLHGSCRDIFNGTHVWNLRLNEFDTSLHIVFLWKDKAYPLTELDYKSFILGRKIRDTISSVI